MDCWFSRDMVRNLVRILDPINVCRRQRNRLIRHQYRNKGPNYLWHIDGYDKYHTLAYVSMDALMDFPGM